jgi:hypothetical protein
MKKIGHGKHADYCGLFDEVSFSSIVLWKRCGCVCFTELKHFAENLSGEL